MKTISYSLTTCTEFIEIQRLVRFLLQHKRPQDSIVVLFDEANGDPEVENFLRTHSENLHGIKHHSIVTLPNGKIY